MYTFKCLGSYIVAYMQAALFSAYKIHSCGNMCMHETCIEAYDFVNAI